MAGNTTSITRELNSYLKYVLLFSFALYWLLQYIISPKQYALVADNFGSVIIALAALYLLTLIPSLKPGKLFNAAKRAHSITILLELNKLSKLFNSVKRAHVITAKKSKQKRSQIFKQLSNAFRQFRLELSASIPILSLRTSILFSNAWKHAGNLTRTSFILSTHALQKTAFFAKRTSAPVKRFLIKNSLEFSFLFCLGVLYPLYTITSLQSFYLLFLITLFVFSFYSEHHLSVYACISSLSSVPLLSIYGKDQLALISADLAFLSFVSAVALTFISFLHNPITTAASARQCK